MGRYRGCGLLGRFWRFLGLEIGRSLGCLRVGIRIHEVSQLSQSVTVTPDRQ